MASEWEAALAELRDSNAKDDGAFFNREKELQRLLSLAELGSKRIVVLVGPNNSGKSTILKRLKALWEGDERLKKHSPIFSLDMRLSDARTPALAAAKIGVQLRKWLRWLQQAAATAARSLRATLEGVTYDAAGLTAVFDEKPESDLTSVMSAITALAYENPGVRPVFIIDEAHKLKAWDGAEVGVLMRSFVAMTKQDDRAVVILASSDDFFCQWFQEHVNGPQWVPLGVGHLSKENACTFYSRLWERREKDREVSDAEWEEVYAVCGGSPLDLENYVFDVSREMDHSDVLQGMVDAMQLLVRTGLDAGDGWEGQKFEVLLRLIVANQGAVGLSVVCKQIFSGDRVQCHVQLRAMVAAGVIHVRYAPADCFYDDFTRPSKSRDCHFVMARSPPHLKAMETCLCLNYFAI